MYSGAFDIFVTRFLHALYIFSRVNLLDSKVEFLVKRALAVSVCMNNYSNVIPFVHFMI